MIIREISLSVIANFFSIRNKGIIIEIGGISWKNIASKRNLFFMGNFKRAKAYDENPPIIRHASVVDRATIKLFKTDFLNIAPGPLTSILRNFIVVVPSIDLYLSKVILLGKKCPVLVSKSL